MAITACQPTPTGGGASATPSAAAATRGAGGTLKLLWWQAPTILNAHQSGGQKDADAAALVNEPLAAWGPDVKPVPRLAAEIPTIENGGVSKDFTTITWKLKPGLKWSDGTDFTADDVVFTYGVISDPKAAATTSDYTEGVAKVEAKDKNTVVVTYASPNPNFYQLFVGSTVSQILQKAQFKDWTGEKFKDAPGNQKPIGTGPYKVKEFKSGDVVVYEMNENYRDADKPYFKEVNLKGGGEAESAARAVFQTGDVDFAWNMQVNAPVLKQIMQGGKADLLLADGPDVERLVINFTDPSKDVNGERSEKSTKHPFLSDLKVRTALAMATDRKTMATQLYGDGLTGQATCNIIEGIPAVKSPNTASMDVCKFDVAGANKLLDDAGWVKGSDGFRSKGGVKMKVLYQTTVSALRQDEQAIVKKNWESIGVQVELKSVPGGTFFASGTSPDDYSHFYADIQMYTSGTDPDPTPFFGQWSTKQIAQKSNGWKSSNNGRYSNPEYDTLLESLQKEADVAKRKDLIIKMNDLLIKDVAIIPLINRKPVPSGSSKTLKGPQANGWDTQVWNIADWRR